VSTRGTGIAGIACFALIVVAGLIEPTFDIPATTASPSEFARYAADHGTDLPLALFLWSVAFGLFLIFAAGVWARLRAAEGDPATLSATFALAAAAMTVLILAGFVPEAVAAYRAPDGEDARLLSDLSFGLLAASGVPTAVACGAYAAVVRRTGTLASWSAWIAVVAAAAHIVVAATFLFDSGFLSLEGQVITWVPVTMFAWIGATSVALLRAARPA
jgi:hypothetical protein